MRGWLDEDRDDLRLQRHLGDSARNWVRSERDDGELYRGGRLDSALDWLAAHAAEVLPDEQVFLAASRTAAEAATRRDQRARRRLRRAFATVAVVAVLAIVAGALAFQQRGTARAAAADARLAAADAHTAADTAEATAYRAETGRLASLAPTLASTDLSLALLLAAESAQRTTDPETLGALQRVLVAADNNLGFLPTKSSIRAVFYDGPGRLVGFTDSDLITWDATTHEQLSTKTLPQPLLDGGTFSSIARASFAGGRAAWVDASFTAWTMPLGSDAEPTRISEEALSVAVHPGGERIAVAVRSGQVRLVESVNAAEIWSSPGDPARTFDEQSAVDLSGYAALANVPVPSVSALAFSPDGAQLVQAHGAFLRHIDPGSGSIRQSVDTVHPAGGRYTYSSARLAFTTAGDPKLIASANTVVSSYTGSNLELISRFDPRRRPLVFPRAVAALPDGAVAVLDGGGELTIIDERDGSLLDEPVAGRVGSGLALAVSPDGRHVVVAGEQGGVVLALDGGGPIRVAAPRTADQLVLTAARDGSWLAAEPTPSSPFPGGEYWDCSAQPLPCGRFKPAGAGPGASIVPEVGFGFGWLFRFVPEGVDTAQAIDSSTRQTVGPVIAKDEDGGFGFVVDPAGEWAAFDNSSPATPGNFSIQVNALSTGQRLATFPITDNFLGTSLSVPPSGASILAGHKRTGDSFVIDTTTWTVETSGLESGAVTASMYSPDGRYLVTVDVLGDLTLRDAASRKPLRRFQADTGAANSLGANPFFSDDGRYLVSAHDGAGRLWDVETGQLIGQPIASLADSSPTAVAGTRPGFVAATKRWVQYWRFDPKEWPATACRLAGRNLTQAEWEQHGPRDQTYRATCPQWATA